MKILQINKFYFLKGGSERYLFDLSKLLKQKGHKVIPFSMKDERNLPSEYSEYFIENINLHKFNIINIIKFFYNYEAVRNLEELIRREKPDIAHLHNIAHQLTPAIINVLKKNNIPVVQTLHDYKLICPNSKLFTNGKYCEACRGGRYYNCFLRNCMHKSRAMSFLGMLEAYLNSKIKKVYDGVDMFIAPSEFMRNVSLKFGISGKKIKVINNFVEALNLKSDPVMAVDDYLLYFGRLSDEKGIASLLEAMKNVKSAIKLKIVGAGPDRNKLESISKKMELENKVEFLGPKYGAALADLINGSMAVVIPSVWPENMPYSLLESMSAGKAVIASRTGGMGEIIENGTNGFLFSPGNIRELVEVIDDLPNRDLLAIGKSAADKAGSLNPLNHYFQLIKIYNRFV